MAAFLIGWILQPVMLWASHVLGPSASEDADSAAMAQHASRITLVQVGQNRPMVLVLRATYRDETRNT